MKIAETATIARPAQQVWETLADFGRISVWAPNVDHSCLMSQRHSGIGTVRRIQTGRATVVERVTHWEPEVRLSYTIEGLPPVVRSVTNTWQLTEAFGTTTVTLTSEIDAGPRPPQKVVARGVGRALAKASAQMISGLNAHVTAAVRS